jgi:hypothetical protein
MTRVLFEDKNAVTMETEESWWCSRPRGARVFLTGRTLENAKTVGI